MQEGQSKGSGKRINEGDYRTKAPLGRAYQVVLREEFDYNWNSILTGAHQTSAATQLESQA
jgi:hypothetical protein